MWFRSIIFYPVWVCLIWRWIWGRVYQHLDQVLLLAHFKHGDRSQRDHANTLTAHSTADAFSLKFVKSDDPLSPWKEASMSFYHRAIESREGMYILVSPVNKVRLSYCLACGWLSHNTLGPVTIINYNPRCKRVPYVFCMSGLMPAFLCVLTKTCNIQHMYMHDACSPCIEANSITGFLCWR